MVTTGEIEAAAQRLEGRVRRTPVVALEAGAAGSPVECVLKLEQLQHTGSFKPRGVFNLLLSRGATGGVVTASGGNAGLAVAYAARELGLGATVFVPTTSPAVKVRRIEELGADVVVAGQRYADAFEAATAHRERTGELFVHAYDGEEILAGQGTVAREMEQQVTGIDTVLVAVGGGGLVGGIASWWAGRVKIVAVEPERAPTLRAALAAGEPVAVEVAGVAADSLGARRIGAGGFAAARRAEAVSVLVPDEAISQARAALWRDLHVVSEPGGAAALAALGCGAYRPEPGERVGVVVCGANTDPSDLTAVPLPAEEVTAT